MDTIDKKIFLIVVLIGLVGACKAKRTSDDAGPRAGVDRPDLKMTHIHLESYGGEHLEWELHAPEALGFTGRHVVYADDLRMNMYENGELSSRVSAERGVVMTDGSDPKKAPPEEMVNGRRLKTGDMILDGNVVVLSTDGARLETEWLWYQRNLDLITSTSPVKLTRADSITTGVGMESTSDLKKVKIFNQKIIIRQ